MTGWEIFLLIVLIYFFFMFVLSQIFVPHLGWKRPVEKKLPENLKKDLKRIGASYNKKEDLLKAVVNYMVVEKGLYGKPRQVFRRFSYLFESKFDKLWNGDGFLHCHQHNFVLRSLLLETGKFSEEDIVPIITNCIFNIHQYTEINISDDENSKKIIKIDTFAFSSGYKYGKILPRLYIGRKHSSKTKN